MLCAVRPHIPNTPDYNTNVAATAVVPNRVHRGATFSVEVTTQITVPSIFSEADLSVSGGANAAPSVQDVQVPLGSKLSGTFQFVAVGKPGSTIDWQLLLIRESTDLGGTLIALTCTPTNDGVLANTQVIGGPPIR
jgi:hypothetical protein